MLVYCYLKHYLSSRDRFCKILSSLEDLSGVSLGDRERLLSCNGTNAEMFALIHAFNKSTWEDELDFLLGHDDKTYIMTYHPSLKGIFTNKHWLKNIQGLQ